MNVQQRLAYIRQAAIARHLDPNAVFAIGGHEGFSGGVGDGGHAFGPFQMNDAGGVLTGAPASHRTNAWAWSNAGINMALDGMARVAAGQHGRAAVTSIASRYERPANVPAEIADAMSRYGQGVGGGGRIQGAGGAGGAVTVNAGPQHATTFNAAQFHKQAGMILLNQAAASANGQAPPGGDVLSQLAQVRKAATMKVSSSGPSAGAPIAGAKGGIGGRIAAIAERQIGTPYVWGGTSKAGFDCSGLTQFAYSKLGIKIPRLAADQGRAGRAVNYANLRPGDLLAEKNGDHVVMYAGNGRVVQAAHTGTNVGYAPLSYFPSSQYNARRIVG